MGKHLKLAVCVPSLGNWDEQFGQCLQKMIVFLAQHPVQGYDVLREVELYQRRGSGIPVMREEFLDTCKQRGDTHCLMIDADQTFPPDTAHRLLFHGKPVVAANIATKTIPSSPTARTKDGTPYGRSCYTDTQHGLEKVWRVGFGIVMIEIAILEKLGRGLFEWIWDDSIKQYRGEDWSFYKRCEDKGVDVYVDHDLSRQVGHIGNYIYSHKDVLNPKKLKAA